MIMIKPKLIILSDIFGVADENWMDEYRNSLNTHFDVVEYDSRLLAGISVIDQGKVHQGFVNGGIDLAVQNLLILEPEDVIILGFSVGGTIAWKCALQSERIKSLYLISATRLRNESNKPSSRICLYFGENERNGPSLNWFETFKLSPAIIENESHECYQKSLLAKHVCTQIISDLG